MSLRIHNKPTAFLDNLSLVVVCSFHIIDNFTFSPIVFVYILPRFADVSLS